MASTYTIAESLLGTIKKYTIVWTSHTDGTIANTLQNDAGDIQFNGMLVRVTIIPGTSGDQPDDNYVMAINDENSVDVLAAQGAALDEATTTDFCPGVNVTDGTYPGSVPFTVAGTLTLAGSGAGSANKGTIVLYFS